MTKSSIPALTKVGIKAAGQDPVKFGRQFLNRDTWKLQEAIMHSVASKPSSRTAVKACHASGKTFVAAEMALWYLARWTKSTVITTAPTWPQIEESMWGEIHALLETSIYPFPKATGTKLEMGPKRYATGRSTKVTKQDEGVKFQSYHNDHVLVIIDEAPGIDPKIWDAIEGIRAGGDVRILALGNPTIASGTFHSAFTENRDGWETFTISAFDTPNLKGLTLEQLEGLSDEELQQNQRPYLITRAWVKEKLHEWGEGHPLWQARVLGEFPAQAEDALLSLAWLEAARASEKPGAGYVTVGLDVAGPGEDETSLTIRRGARIIYQQSWTKADPRGEVVAAIRVYERDLDKINVDAIGIGWGVFLHLVDVFGEQKVIPVNVGEASPDKEKFSNLKAHLYWGLRERLKAGDMAGLTDERTIGQLAGLRYKHNARGQIVIESKEDARKRGVKSPDRAESTMLAFADVPRLVEDLMVYEERVQISPELDEIESTGYFG